MTEKGIILQKINYKEYDKIIYLLSPRGKDSLLVRRANRYKEGLTNLTEPLTYVSYVKSHHDLPQGSELMAINYFLKIKNDPLKWAIAEYTIEVLYHLNYQDIDCSLLFEMMVKFYSELENASNVAELFLAFQIKTLFFRGVMPNTQTCGVCQTESNLVGLNAKLGSVVCRLHSLHALSSEATNAFFNLYRDRTFSITLSMHIINELLQFLNDYTEYHFDFKPKSLVLVGKYLAKYQGINK